VVVLDRILRQEQGWVGVVTEVLPERGLVRVQWDRPGPIIFNMDFFTARDVETRFRREDGFDGWTVK